MAEKKDMTKLSKVELMEMLQRQEKILQNRKLINSLPDKGQKIHNMVEKLNEIINKREQADDLSSRIQRISLSQKTKKVQQSELDSDDDDDDEKDVNMDDKGVGVPASISETTKKSQTELDSDDDDSDDDKDVNMDDKSVGAAASISETTQKTRTEEVKDKKQKPDKWAYDSAVTYARKPKFEKIKLIPVDESITIQQQQNDKYEALRTKQAAERLMQYRNPASSQSSFTFTSQEAKSRYRDTVQEDEYQEDEEHSEAEDIQEHEESGED